jgi:CRISPR-associated protein Cmr4
MRGVFAWVTCPEVLNRFKKDMEISGKNFDRKIPKENSVTENSNLIISGSNNNIVLEEYTFSVNKNNETKELAKYLADKIYGNSSEHSYWKEKLQNDLVVLNDNDFRDFVNLSTEVITRTKISNETGTVETGALFTEEYLPSDSIMYSIVMTSPIFCKNKGETFKDDKNTSQEVMKFFTTHIPPVMQIGGNYTLGKGIVKISIDKEGV